VKEAHRQDFEDVPTLRLSIQSSVFVEYRSRLQVQAQPRARAGNASRLRRRNSGQVDALMRYVAAIISQVGTEDEVGASQ